MDFKNYDLYFPHLNIGIEHMRNSITVFGYRIAFYGIIIGFGMLMGFLVATRDYKRRGFDPDVITDFGLYTVILAVLGARIYYVIFEWEYYSKHLNEIINIRQGGLAIYGGVIMSVICCVVFTKRRKISFYNIADSGIIGMILGQAIGRWGNFFNMEAFGGYTDSLFAMRLKESAVNPNMMNDDVLSHMINVGGVDYIQVHPTFLYESCWNFCVFLVLYFVIARKKKFEGQVFYSYLLLYGIGRFFIEGLRTDSLYLWGTGIAVSQALSAVLAVGSAAVIAFRLSRQKASAAQA